MLGTMVLGATLFTNAAFAKEVATQPEKPVFGNGQGGWINMPLEDQTITITNKIDSNAAAKGWVNAPLEDQTIVVSDRGAFVAPTQGWVNMPQKTSMSFWSAVRRKMFSRQVGFKCRRKTKQSSSLQLLAKKLHALVG